MSAEYQSSYVKAPADLGNAANDFNVRLYTATTTHRADPVPREFAGKYVRIAPSGSDLHYAFSKSSTAEVSTAVAATDAGASLLVGDVIRNNEHDHVRLPSVALNETLYFVRESVAINTTVRMRLASG
jgi:hypothetical protein